MTIRSALTSLLLCTVLFSSALAAEPEPMPPAALPATFLPLVHGDGIARDLSIAALEITQSTQTASNSVPLVAGRATVVRVYAVSSGDPVPGVVVSLAASRNGVPLPGSPVRAGPKTVTRMPTRLSYDTSFNLLLPQAWLAGTIALVATVDSTNTVAETNEANNRALATASFGSVPPLDIKIVPIRYTHTPNGRTYAPPTVDTVSQWAMKTFPLHAVRVSFRAPLDYSGNLGDGTAWERLLDQVTTLRMAEGAPAGQIYYALVPTQNGADRWFNGGIAGIGWVGMRAAVSLDFGPGQEEKTGRIAAHEIGHNLRRYHAPCGTTADPRQPYPHPGASIGVDVLGLDIATGRVWSPGLPDSARDVMSYCTPQWVSDFTYTALYQEQRTTGSAAASSSGDALFVRAVFDQAGQAALLPAYIVRGASPAPGGSGEYAIELLDATGIVVARHAVDSVEAEAPHGFGEERDHASHTHAATAGLRRIHALLPVPAVSVTTIRLLRGTAVLATQEISIAEQQSLFAPEARVRTAATGQVELRWTPPQTPALVRASADGRRWTMLGVDVTGGVLAVAPAVLEGMTTIEVTPAGAASFVLPLPKRAIANAPPQVWISGPRQAKAGEPALLYGQASDAEDGALDELHWTLDGQPVAGTQTLQLGALAAGSYTVTLTATDSGGQSVRVAHTLSVVP